MDTVYYLKMLVKDFHSVVMATLNDEGRPETRVIDLMLYDEQGLYFLTAKGKNFYHQLQEQGYISLSGTRDKRAVRFDGFVRNIGQEKLAEIFIENPYMAKIYPENTRQALEVFQIYQGTGEYFDISNPSHIERDDFILGDAETHACGYRVNEDACIGCQKCLSVCPQHCISIRPNGKAVIDRHHCLSCGRCAEICPVQAITKSI
ncbi:4Fe-4S dicluster-binding protein [Mitsuokella sp. WILCCON 0060]|uniref:4Fe-4S dicluster-binding protein n=1 Tax=unclassified Mitsuokella TaxID=2637239 RepID=UPI003F0DEB92